MNNDFFELNNIVVSEDSSIEGDGWLEQESVIYGILKGRFYVGLIQK